MGILPPKAADTEVHTRNVSNANTRIRDRDAAATDATGNKHADRKLAGDIASNERFRTRAISQSRTGFGKHPDSAKKGFQNSPLATRRYIPNINLTQRQAASIKRSQDLQAREPKTTQLAASTELDWKYKLFEHLTETEFPQLSGDEVKQAGTRFLRKGRAAGLRNIEAGSVLSRKNQRRLTLVKAALRKAFGVAARDK